MGQIVFNGQKPKYCNLTAITTGSKKDYVIPAGEVWLIDSTNTSKTDGTGKYDKYIIGDSSHTASYLATNALMNIDNALQIEIDSAPTSGSNNAVSSGGVYQAIQSIDVSSQVSSKEDKSNKVTSFSSPTDTQYPSAKLVSDQLATKQDTISDLSTIRSGASAGATAYQKPGTGIPSTDLASAVQTSLGKADTAIQSLTVGTTTTVAAGSSASVTNTGTATEPVLSFTIPQGAQGIQGIQGIQGPQGEQGPKGDTGVTAEASDLVIKQAIDVEETYADTDIAGAVTVKKLTNEDLSNERVIAAALVEFASYFDDGYRFKGLITDSVEESAAEEQIQKVAYLGFPGTYKNIGNNTFVVPEEHVGLFTYDGSNWNLKTVKYQPDAYKKITDFSDWTVGYIDSDGRIYDATGFVYKFLKVLAGQTLTVESYHPYTAIRKIDGTPISSSAVLTPKNIFTYTPEKTEHVYVCVYTGTSFGDKTPPVVTLSNVGTKWLSKENITEFDGSNAEIETEEEYSFISAKSLKQKNVTTETDGLWLRGSIAAGKIFVNTALGSIYKFKNDNYSYLYANIPSLRTENYRYWYAVSFFSDEEVSENTFIDGVTYENVDNHFVKMSIPDGCQYIYVSAGTANGVSNRNSVVRLYRDSSFLSFGELLDNFQIQKDTTIFDGVNDLPSIYDKYGQYIDIRNNFAYPGASTTPKTNFRFIFCSDVHKNEDAFKRIVNLTNRWAADGCVDALINTGDVAYDRPNESFDWYNALRLQSKVDVLTTVGNHDWDYYIGGDKERTYNNIIAPMIGKVENIIQPSDGAEAYRFYYYKDYDTVRFIALYVRVDAADQLTWLEEVLEDARINEKHVIIANHEPFNTNLAHLKFSSPEEFYNKVPNTFFSSFGSIQSPSYVESGGTIPTSYCLAVKNFMDAGGTFVCWLSGHIHIDHFYYLEDTDTYGHQLMLNTAAVRQDKLTGEYVRKGSIGNRDLYNFISVSTDQMMLKVLRIGANTDYIGRSKIVFTYHYGIHKMISNY